MSAELHRLAHWVYVAARPRDDTVLLLHIAAALPDDTRGVIILRKVYGMHTGDIAARLGLTPRGVEEHLVTAALAGCALACSCAHLTDRARTAHRDARP